MQIFMSLSLRDGRRNALCHGIEQLVDAPRTF